ncbi:hypothetical protein K2173_009947 [Erythroxylum novogranatense]|uniref:Non-specific lipid-transfer protein n=1 Tax=Erythroxylum novogranatense TaxID=1862640 RepID=A0AAV8SZD0_9ROSI|nr:hypothetical protein K2173_009947 [Erythroxylum novogranatense]
MASNSMKLLGMLVLCMVVTEIVTDVKADINCASVTNNFFPCLSYLLNGGSVSKDCCNGIKATADSAVNTQDRQKTCDCLKNAANSTSAINPQNAASLPNKCGVPIPFNISASIDCSKVQ